MDVYEVKKKFGAKLAFYGGISTQKTLPYGTPEDVKEECLKMMSEVGKGGGYILSPAHAIPKDVPAENIAQLLDVLQNQRDGR